MLAVSPVANVVPHVSVNTTLILVEPNVPGSYVDPIFTQLVPSNL